MYSYRNCRFCLGRGCLACEGENERDMKKSFDNPLLVIKGMPDQDPQGWEILKRSFHKDVIEKIYENAGGNPNLVSFLLQDNLENVKREVLNKGTEGPGQVAEVAEERED